MGEGGGCPFGEGIASCPRHLVSHLYHDQGQGRQRGLPKAMLELEELKLLSDSLDSLDFVRLLRFFRARKLFYLILATHL